MALNVIPLVGGFAQLIIGLFLAIGAIYIGMSLFGKITKGIDEQAELKKGNVAVGIVLGAVILSIANVIQSGVVGLTNALMANPLSPSWGAILGGVAQLVIGIILAVVGIYLAMSVLDKITKDIDEMAELKKGNVAVAIVMASVLMAVSFVVQAGINGIALAIGVSL
jgi:uncharacterized membrane protein YjfL (UPF0719 family)